MAKVVVTDTQDWRKISELAGGDPDLIMFDPGPSELECPDVLQAPLDTALAAYIADQTNIDAATAAATRVVADNAEKSRFDERKIFRALVEVLLDEINALRTIEGLPLRTIAQARTAILAKIDSL
jgi:hypothetical protein